uniref:non-specific serine/threonine protein kinase n=1 Tax=Kalanchoe fedtschenkoi TaxID=63787 RepID=A0A7N0ZVI7_KALFE
FSGPPTQLNNGDSHSTPTSHPIPPNLDSLPSMPPIPTWFLLAFFLLLTTLSTALSRTHRHQQSCSSSCGAISNITYPFRINSDPVECGDGDYELVCEDNQTMLEIGHGKFLVKNISYAENLIRVVDVELAKGSCGMPLTVQFDYLLIGDNRYMLTGSTVESVYVNCSRKVLNENYTEVPCLSGNHSYVYVVYDYSLSEIIASLNESCEAVATVRSDKVGRKNRSYENIVKVLQSGFELGWNIECRDCHRSGGFCVHIEHSRTVICEKTDAAEIVHLLINLISTIVGTLFFCKLLCSGIDI